MSVLKEVYIPPMSLIYWEHSKFFVIDGKQRFNALTEYYNGKFAIEYGGKLYKFCDLDDDAKRALSLYNIIANVAYEYEDDCISDAHKIEWFKLINWSCTPHDQAHLDSLK